MNYAISCIHCARTIIIVPAIGEREAALMLAHLTEHHAAVVDAGTTLGDLLQHFTIVEHPVV